jgi:hypothetical protein
MLLNIGGARRIVGAMSIRRITLALVASLALASPAAAGCYADYKAKRENPLQLHYGVISVSDDNCSAAAAADEVERRIGSDGWELLAVVSVFDDAGLDSRRDSAGAYFLRY